MTGTCKGSGRGRGWLKLDRNSEPTRPGSTSNGIEINKNLETPSQQQQQPQKNLETPQQPQKNLEAPQQPQINLEENDNYDELFEKFEHISSEDDGILFNSKLKYIRDVFMNLCKTEDEITKATKALYNRCLENEKFIEKFVLFVSSAFFINNQNKEPYATWKNTTRRVFINNLQEKFENRETLRKTNPTMFYNSVKLFSFYINRSRRIVECYRSIEKIGVNGYLSQLLEHLEHNDIKLFIILVCENAVPIVRLNKENNIEFLQILEDIKLKILTSENLTKNHKMILFFAWELMKSNYGLKGKEIEFYEKNLDKNDIKDIFLQYHFIIDSDKNNEELPRELPHNGNDAIFDGWCQKNYSYTKAARDSYDKKVKRFNIDWKVGDDFDQEKNEKVGRPILGVGARLKRN